MKRSQITKVASGSLDDRRLLKVGDYVQEVALTAKMFLLEQGDEVVELE